MARTHSAALRVAPAADISTLTDALRRARRATSAPVTSTYIRNLARDLLSKDRRGGVRQIVALARDAFERGAPIADLLDFGYRYLDMVRSWYARRDAARAIPVTIAAMHLAEERAEGDRECAETAFVHERTPTSALAFLRAHEDYERLEAPLLAAARGIAGGGEVREWSHASPTTQTARGVASTGGHSEAGTYPGTRNLTAARAARNGVTHA